MKTLNIKTSDGGSFQVDWDIIQKSQTIKTMVEDLGIDQDSINEDTIPLPNEEVTETVFKKVLQWCEKYRDVPDKMEGVDDEDDDELKAVTPVSWSDLDAWQKKYVDIPVHDMFPLLICANFLEIKGLIKLMVKAVALQIQGKDVEQIRKTFNVEDPKWTPEELKQLEEENAWAYDTKK